MPSKILIEKAIKYLLKDSLSYIDMLEPLRRGTADIIYAENDGVVIYEQNSQACMISMQKLEKCQSVIDLKKYHLFDVHQEYIAKWIQQRKNFFHHFKAYQAVYNKKEMIVDKFDAIRGLSCNYTDQICQYYNTMDDRKYIENLINRKQLWGIFDHGALAGFIGEHLEGSIGLLEVLPEYRRKGYGYRLEAFLINRFLQLNEIPFGQVMIGNIASLLLQQKIGMNLSQQPTIWIFD